MKIFDMHIHTNTDTPDPARFIEALDASGTYGACIFSQRPDVPEYVGTGRSFDARLDQIFAWCRGYEDRLYPVIWMDPTEENVLEKIRIADERGVAGFKFIATTWSPDEERFLEVARAIAATGKPMFLHSGIHYSAKSFIPNLNYNRPAAFAKLCTIPGLRFSMGHCSWPWIDECLALFGKWAHYVSTLPAGTPHAEMYLDITPGTPELWREELLTKLYRSIQNTGDFILHGTDMCAETYDSKIAAARLAKDRKILDTLGVSRAMRERAYHTNLMRFLGKPEYTESFTFRCWGFDSTAKETKAVCRKWYDRLGFSKEYDAAFQKALDEVRISDAITVDTYDLSSADGKRNLLSFLYFCESLEKRYAEKGIEESVLLDTLRDIVIWTDVWSEVKGELYLGELFWLKRHLSMQLFRIGSLEYVMGKAPADCPVLGLKKGDNVLDVHIPNGASLTPEACRDSMVKAKEFFKKHYPEFEFSHFSCHSWLLDPELEKLLDATSNILAFGRMFTLSEEAAPESYAALRYVFRWDTTKNTLRNAYPVSRFAERMKKHVMGGGKLYERIGAIKADDIQ